MISDKLNIFVMFSLELVLHKIPQRKLPKWAAAERVRRRRELESPRLQPLRREPRGAEVRKRVRACGGADLFPLRLGLFGCSCTSAPERRCKS